jgi:hypothetical protein
MRARTFLASSLLAATVLAGCHHGVHDDYDDYGSSYDNSYREGYRDGRAAERRRGEGRTGRYYGRDDWRYR